MNTNKVPKLTREQWEALIVVVYERDLQEAWKRSEDAIHHRVPFHRWRTNHQEKACVATFLDPLRSGPCLGRLQFDHVPERGKTTMRKKAPDDEAHLVTVCCWHHGTCRVGGGWSTGSRARELARDYLSMLYGPRLGAGEVWAHGLLDLPQREDPG